MKRITCMALAWLALLADNAHAAKTMAEKEQAQTIVWIVEAASFITIIAVGWFVWRLSTRAANNRKPKQEA
jgi:heme/copper-type cytochrome/quinol oxidase subunit 2